MRKALHAHVRAGKNSKVTTHACGFFIHYIAARRGRVSMSTSISPGMLEFHWR